jgi:hypothetical protein
LSCGSWIDRRGQSFFLPLASAGAGPGLAAAAPPEEEEEEEEEVLVKDPGAVGGLLPLSAAPFSASPAAEEFAAAFLPSGGLAPPAAGAPRPWRWSW